MLTGPFIGGLKTLVLRACRHVLAGLAPLTLSFSASAEVSDKMASQPGIWVSGVVVGILLTLGIRWSRWGNLVGVPVAAGCFYFAWDTLNQPHIGPAIIKEQGTPYIIALYGSAALVAMGVLLGNYLNKLRGRKV